MKITLIHQYFITPSMNGGTRSYETARRLVEMGHEVEVVTSSQFPLEASRGWTVSAEQGVRVHWYPVRYSNSMGFLNRLAAFFSFAVVASYRAAQIKTDLVLAMSTPLTVAIPGVVTSKIRKVPLVFEVGDLWPEVPIAMGVIGNPVLKFLARSLEKWAYANSAAVVTLSPQMKEGVVASGFPASNVAVIPNACDFEMFSVGAESVERFFSTREHMREKPIILYPGTFGAVNGVGYAVDLASELLAIGSDVIFLLVGEGREKERVAEQARVLGVLGVNLFIENAVPKRDVVAMFSAATCVANLVVSIPALYSNSANKFFDALAASKPLLLNFDGWMTKIVNDRRCGLDVSGLGLRPSAEIVHARLHDAEWLAAARVEAGKVGKEFFSRAQLVDELSQVISAVKSGAAHRAEAIAPGVY